MRHILFFGAVLISLAAEAQKGPAQVSITSRFVEVRTKFLADIGVDFALGDFANTHSIGPSVGGGAYFKVNNNMMWGIHADENYFFGKEIAGTSTRHSNENILRIITSVLIRNNKTTIIGGLNAGLAHVSTKGYSENSFTWGVSVGVPLLKNIPVLGGLFSSRNHSAAKTNLIIFLSPVMAPSDDKD